MALTVKDLTQEEFLHLLNQGPEVATAILKLSQRQLLSRLTAYYYVAPTVQHLNLLCAFGREGKDIIRTTAQAPGFFPAEVVTYAKRLLA